MGQTGFLDVHGWEERFNLLGASEEKNEDKK